MTLLSPKNCLKAILFAISATGICTSVNAMELRPLAQFEFPADVTINKRIESVKEEKEWETDPVFIIGTELLFSAEFAPIRYGVGLAFKSSQKDGSNTITPAFLPIWGNISFGLYKKDWFAVPYATVRIGTMGALTGEGSWWERPFNFFIDAGIGAIFPYNIGFEVNFDFSSVYKSFEHRDTKIRISSGRIGLQLSIGFELTHERIYNAN